MDNKQKLSAEELENVAGGIDLSCVASGDKSLIRTVASIHPEVVDIYKNATGSKLQAVYNYLYYTKRDITMASLVPHN